MYVISADTGNELFEKTLDLIKTGEMVAPRRMTTLEIPGPTALQLYYPSQALITNPYRKLNYAFAMAEFLWIWSGSNSLDELTPYNKKMAEFSDDGVTLAGAYGPPFRAQLPYIVSTLTGDRDSRQAVMTLWKPNPHVSKDIPCTVMLHFTIRNFLLHLTVYMRSNDVWLGLPYDLNTFTSIQLGVASLLNIKAGTYTHIVGSMHMYAGDVYKIEWALKYPGQKIFINDLTYSDAELLIDIEPDIRKKRAERSEVARLPNTLWGKSVVKLLNHKLNKTAALTPFFSLLEEECKSVHAKIGGSSNASSPTGDSK